jgi:hypothetical protein
MLNAQRQSNNNTYRNYSVCYVLCLAWPAAVVLGAMFGDEFGTVFTRRFWVNFYGSPIQQLLVMSVVVHLVGVRLLFTINDRWLIAGSIVTLTASIFGGILSFLYFFIPNHL